jgi:hypothetical protein
MSCSTYEALVDRGVIARVYACGHHKAFNPSATISSTGPGGLSFSNTIYITRYSYLGSTAAGGA